MNKVPGKRSTTGTYLQQLPQRQLLQCSYDPQHYIFIAQEMLA
jgi:hypothetical protein